MHFLEEGARGGFDEPVPQRFNNIVVQLEGPNVSLWSRVVSMICEVVSFTPWTGMVAELTGKMKEFVSMVEIYLAYLIVILR